MRFKKQPTAQQAYDQLADAFAEQSDTKPHNAYYERPATISLLPDVNGLRVLDAGCGPGWYANWLVDHGARVVAFDANEKMVQHTRRRLGDRAEVLQATLDQPLSFLADESFDIVLSPLVLDYVEDWHQVFGEFQRVLKPGGVLVFSMEHPHPKFETHKATSNYFSTDLVEYTYRGFGNPVRVPSYRRPLGEVINPLIQAGFIVDAILEPRPTEQFKQKDPEDYDALMRNPGFLCIRAVKRPCV